jgi:hypothetical protein
MAGTRAIVGLALRGRLVDGGVERAADGPAAEGVRSPTNASAPGLSPPVPARSEMPTIAVSAAAMSESASHPDGPRTGSRSGDRPPRLPGT